MKYQVMSHYLPSVTRGSLVEADVDVIPKTVTLVLRAAYINRKRGLTYQWFSKTLPKLAITVQVVQALTPSRGYQVFWPQITYLTDMPEALFMTWVGDAFCMGYVVVDLVLVDTENKKGLQVLLVLPFM